ncbi:hypothetical protein CC2G_013293 [Coprinopsis cinerea AmutBmut pab1-1]|nr:hypothetical protein CC2G_013293 [Coprinopsis cinerea AmutBmut pab1-1]
MAQPDGRLPQRRFQTNLDLDQMQFMPGGMWLITARQDGTIVYMKSPTTKKTFSCNLAIVQVPDSRSGPARNEQQWTLEVWEVKVRRESDNSSAPPHLEASRLSSIWLPLEDTTNRAWVYTCSLYASTVAYAILREGISHFVSILDWKEMNGRSDPVVRYITLELHICTYISLLPDQKLTTLVDCEVGLHAWNHIEPHQTYNLFLTSPTEPVSRVFKLFSLAASFHIPWTSRPYYFDESTRITVSTGREILGLVFPRKDDTCLLKHVFAKTFRREPENRGRWACSYDTVVHRRAETLYVRLQWPEDLHNFKVVQPSSIDSDDGDDDTDESQDTDSEVEEWEWESQDQDEGDVDYAHLYYDEVSGKTLVSYLPDTRSSRLLHFPQ